MLNGTAAVIGDEVAEGLGAQLALRPVGWGQRTVRLTESIVALQRKADDVSPSFRYRI